MTDEWPMPLKHAAEITGIGVATLKAERARGRLKTHRIGREIRTTLADIREMVELCREEPRAPASIVTRRAVNTSSETAAASLDSAQQTVLRLRNSLRTTSRESTGRSQSRVR